MKQYNMHEAKTNLSSLVKESTLSGEPFLISVYGKPKAKVVPLAGGAPKPRCGFLKGYGVIPPADTFNRIGDDEIAAMFEGVGE